jgi:predicted RNA-binding protein with PUA-like domain
VATYRSPFCAGADNLFDRLASWIVKSEPTEYSFAQLVEDQRTAWTGIKNPLARKNLQAMKPGELALFYHTGHEKAVVGIARVSSVSGAEVELSPVKLLAMPVPLSVLKAKAATKNISVVKMGRLSVGALKETELAAVLKLSNTTL